MSDYRLDAISPLDGRYSEELKDLPRFVSEAALTRYRVTVEASWLLYLAKPEVAIVQLEEPCRLMLERLASGHFPETMVIDIKRLEKQTNHDVKAVEYWLQGRLKDVGANPIVRAHVHFACTSEDINNSAYALMMRDIRQQLLLPLVEKLKSEIEKLARNAANSAMISRTHGQSATPTTMGKEMSVFIFRINRQIRQLQNQPVLAKFNGAVGNYNAHYAAYPHLDWQKHSKCFIEQSLGLQWNPMTTQIESHDALVEFFDTVHRLNAILIDFARDMWGYISLGYFVQRTIEREVGSSTMPHKVNPIYFENAEGNLGLSNSMLSHFSQKLPISRWQRDLSDSTVLRSSGSALGHAILAYKNLARGMERVTLSPKRMLGELEECWELLSEPVQTVMRRYGVVDAYDRLKIATRGSASVTKEMIHGAIDGCQEIPDSEKMRMKEWTPQNYIGLAPQLAMGSFGE